MRVSSSCIVLDTLSSSMLAGGGEELGVGSDFALAFEEALILNRGNLDTKAINAIRPKAQQQKTTTAPGTRRVATMLRRVKERARQNRMRHCRRAITPKV